MYSAREKENFKGAKLKRYEIIIMHLLLRCVVLLSQ